MLRTKSFLDEKEPIDGLRISVMRNHLKPGTLQPDPDIPDDAYDLWKPSFAPKVGLLNELRNDEISWEDFSEEYREYLRHPMNGVRMHQLAQIALEETVTLLSKEADPEHSYRTIIANCISQLYPKLETELK